MFFLLEKCMLLFSSTLQCSLSSICPCFYLILLSLSFGRVKFFLDRICWTRLSFISFMWFSRFIVLLLFYYVFFKCIALVFFAQMHIWLWVYFVLGWFYEFNVCLGFPFLVYAFQWEWIEFLNLPCVLNYCKRLIEGPC